MISKQTQQKGWIMSTRSAKLEMVFFSFVGIAGFIVDAGIVFSFTGSGANAIWAQAVAFSVAVTVTWLLNRKFTFAQHASHNWQRELMHYVAANSVGAVVTNAVYMYLILNISVFSRNPVSAVAVGAMAGLFFNFTASRVFVFRKI